MNKEEILNKYIDLIDKGYCSDCNELNCIDNFPHAKITHGIRELQQENKKYKEVIDKAIDLVEKLIKEYKLNYGDEPSKMLLVYETLLNTLREVE